MKRRHRREICLLLLAAPALWAADEEVSDDLLYDRVNRALITDRELGTHQLAVAVASGAVVVEGWVETEKLQKRVEKVVKKVKGVKTIDNRVQIRR